MLVVIITKLCVATTTLNHEYNIHNIQEDSPNTLHIHVHAAPPYCASSTAYRPDQPRPRKVKGHHGYWPKPKLALLPSTFEGKTIPECSCDPLYLREDFK